MPAHKSSHPVSAGWLYSALQTQYRASIARSRSAPDFQAGRSFRRRQERSGAGETEFGGQRAGRIIRKSRNTEEEAKMKIKTNVRAGYYDRCGGYTRCGGSTRCGGGGRCGGTSLDREIY
jgi:hypothetical protein